MKSNHNSWFLGCLQLQLEAAHAALVAVYPSEQRIWGVVGKP
jgi:hypothetical protein